MESNPQKIINLFNRLLKETNNSEANLEWLPDQKPSLYGLCYELNLCFKEISRYLFEKKIKPNIVPKNFPTKWFNYKKHWELIVSKVAKIEEERLSQKEMAVMDEALGGDDISAQFWQTIGWSLDNFLEYYSNKLGEEGYETALTHFMMIRQR